jgi:hypothetical protein
MHPEPLFHFCDRGYQFLEIYCQTRQENSNLRTCFKSCYAARLLRYGVLEILMCVQYTLVSALPAPRTQTACDAFKTRSNRRGHLRERKSSKKLSNSSNESKLPAGALAITLVPFLYLFL